VAGCSEDGNKTLSFIKGEEFLDKLNYYQNHSCLWVYFDNIKINHFTRSSNVSEVFPHFLTHTMTLEFACRETSHTLQNSCSLYDQYCIKTHSLLRRRNVASGAMLTYGVVEVQLHVFLTSALGGGECQLHVPTALLPSEESRSTL
jgi:hypothetical protein